MYSMLSKLSMLFPRGRGALKDRHEFHPDDWALGLEAPKPAKPKRLAKIRVHYVRRLPGGCLLFSLAFYRIEKATQRSSGRRV